MFVMKKKLLFIAVATLLFAVSCTKEKHCRCGVLRSQTVRIVTISSGSCKSLNQVKYRDDLDTLFTDTVVCTDYPFEADSLIEYRK